MRAAGACPVTTSASNLHHAGSATGAPTALLLTRSAGAMVQVADVPFATAEIVTFFPVTLASATV